MWKNNVEPGRPQVTIWHIHIACWVTKFILTFVIPMCLSDSYKV